MAGLGRDFRSHFDPVACQLLPCDRGEKRTAAATRAKLRNPASNRWNATERPNVEQKVRRGKTARAKQASKEGAKVAQRGRRGNEREGVCKPKWHWLVCYQQQVPVKQRSMSLANRLFLPLALAFLPFSFLSLSLLGTRFSVIDSLTRQPRAPCLTGEPFNDRSRLSDSRKG